MYIHLPLKMMVGASVYDLLCDWGPVYLATFLAPFYMGPNEREREKNYYVKVRGGVLSHGQR